MKIEIKNLGAVKSATIDISKKLNLFCGPNGTGKTYIAYAIYDIFKSDFHIGTNEIFDNSNFYVPNSNIYFWRLYKSRWNFNGKRSICHIS